MSEEVKEIKEEQKSNRNNLMMIIIGIMGSLLAFMFYGRIEDANHIIQLQGEVATLKEDLKEKASSGDMIQAKSELRDVWGKYNEAGTMINTFMVQDAREKEKIKEEILRVELKDTERWLEFWKEKAQK